jgi:ketosteroid isomerase-like protein
MPQNPEEFLKAYETALATQDWQTVSPLIHEKACVTFSDGSVYMGKAEVQRAFERNFSLIQDEKYAISDIYWVQKTQDFAVCLFAFHWQGVIQGKPASGSGRGTSFLVYEKGKWFLISEHLCPNPE